MNTSYLKRKADHYEVYHVKAKSLNAEMTKGEMDFAVNGESEGLAITVVKGRRMGFAYTNNIKNFKKAADKAISIAMANDRDKNLRGFVKPQRVRKIKNYDSGLINYSLQDLAKFKTAFLKGLRFVNKAIMLSNASYIKAIENVEIINSEGVDLQETSAANTFSYDLVLKKKGELLAAYGSKEDVKPMDAEFAIDEARRVVALSGKKQVKTMSCQAIFHPEALASLFHGTLVPNIDSENVQNKQSILADSLNKAVASRSLTVIDDAVTKGLFATNSFDCEGTPSQRNTIIDRGVLKTFLYNNYTAQKGGKKSTANATRTPYTLPSVGANNLLVLPGKEKDMISDIKRGVYVREILGAHTMNSLTGDFSLGLLEGFYIKNGKIKHPIRNAMIAGNFYKLLNQITGIGSCVSHASGATYTPEIKFSNIKLVGKD